MILRHAILMPAGICLLLLITYLTRQKKSKVQHLFTAAAALLAIYLFADACYVVDYADTLTFVLADAFAHFAGPAAIVTTAYILYEMHKPGREATHIKAMYTLAMGVGLMSTIPYELMTEEQCAYYIRVVNQSASHVQAIQNLYDIFGKTSIEYIHYIISVPVYYGICTIGILAILGYIIHCFNKEDITLRSLYRFLFKDEEYDAFKVECWMLLVVLILIVIRMAMGRGMSIAHPGITLTISLLLTVSLYLILYTGLVTHLNQFTLSELFHPLLFMPTLTTDENQEATRQAFATDEKYLKEELQRLMHEKNVYTNPNLTIEDVANAMGTNRVYVSQIVNQHYNITFREYITYLRLKAAKEYMLAHPEAKQEDVARLSGFSDAASFNKRFRQQESCTPREWLSKQSHKQE